MLSTLGLQPDSSRVVRSYERAAASFERQIRLAEGRGDGSRALGLYDDYEALLEAWRAHEELLQRVPPDGELVEPHRVPEDEAEHLRRLLARLEGARTELPEERLARICVLYATGAFEQALGLIERMLGVGGMDGRLLRYRGQCQLRLGRWGEALATFERALDLGPGGATALAGKGQALAELGHPREALVHLGRALEAAPNVPELHFRVAECLVALDRVGVACLAYDRAVALAPDCRLYREKRARALLYEGHLDAALEAYDDVLGGRLPEPPPAAKRAPALEPAKAVALRQRVSRRRQRRKRRLVQLALALAGGLVVGWLMRG